MVHVSAGPPAIPDSGISPARFWPWLPVSRLPIPREVQVLTHIRPIAVWFASTGAPLFPGPTCPATPGAAKCPEPLCMPKVLPWASWSLRTMSADVTPLSSLLRAHAPVLLPPGASVVPSTPGMCRLLSAPAGERTFPTLSLRLCPCVRGPLPRRLVRCTCPFLPSRQRPSPRADRVGAPRCTVQRLPYGARFEAVRVGWRLPWL